MMNLDKVNSLTEIINDPAVTELTITVETEEKLLKKNNPLNDRKVTKVIVCDLKTNTNYTTEVNKQRVLEGKETNFESGSSWFKLHTKGIHGDIVDNKKDPEGNDIKYYLKGIVSNNRSTVYKIDGRDASEDEMKTIKLYKPKSSSVSKSQGVETPIIVRTFDINNIISVTTNKTVIL